MLGGGEPGFLPHFASYLGSLQTPGDFLWPSLIPTWLEEPVPARPLLEVKLCLEWPVEEEVPIWSGVAQRRLDVILDVLQTPASAGDIQQAYWSIGTGLAAEASGRTVRGAKMTPAPPALAVQLSAAASGQRWDVPEMTHVFARSAVEHQLAIAEQDEDTASEIRQWWVREYRSTLDEIASRRLEGAPVEGREGIRAMLRDLLLHQFAVRIHVSDDVPVSVTGLRLSDARDVLDSLEWR